MPRFDGTGPRGEGPMTGGGQGYCVTRVPTNVSQAVAMASGIARGVARAVPFFGRGLYRGARLGLGLARRRGLGGGRGRRWF